MKFNLLDRDYNLDELFYQIQMFEAYNNREPHYIVMNEGTLDYIQRRKNYRAGQDIYFRHNQRYIGEIFGIPVAYHQGLDFGVVDIV